MGTPESVRAAHARALPVIEEIQRYVGEALRGMAHRNGYLFMDRVKESGSLAEKLETGRYKSWAEINDLYGATIVVPVAQHEESVVDFLDQAFVRQDLKSRSSTRKDPTVFRFDGVRWYGRARPELTSEKQPGFTEQMFEVQVITAFEWAWSKVTHELVYKGDNASWRHRRLAAHLKATVEQIELMIAAFDQASSEVVPSPWPETDSADRVVKRFQKFVADGHLDEAGSPASWTRFGDNVVSVVKSFKPTDLNASVDHLLDSIDEELSSGSIVVPISVGFFQYVIEHVGRTNTSGHLRRYCVVPSSEYQLLGSAGKFPLEFKFDGTSVAADVSGI